ncbi:hypothetical protein R1sor_025464 [Riccia sorocarpa]|uniref:Uncharacterized protein n=1 Tax=Riccia sorocarpa TaxID=122646 RepID=A0ABD3GA27_9MARC
MLSFLFLTGGQLIIPSFLPPVASAFCCFLMKIRFSLLQSLLSSEKTSSSSLKLVVTLEEVGVFFYCFKGSVSLEGFRGWIASNWVSTKKFPIVSSRPIGSSAFVTIFESGEDRDKALESRVATVRSTLLVHYPWSPQVDDPRFTPSENPLPSKFCSTWAKDLLPEVFGTIAPVLRISPAAKALSVENPHATVLWDPSRPRPKSIALEIEGEGEYARSCKLKLLVKFPDIEEPTVPSNHDSQQTKPWGETRKTTFSGVSNSTTAASNGSSASLASPQAFSMEKTSSKSHSHSSPAASPNSADTSSANGALVPFNNGSFFHPLLAFAPSAFPAAPTITEITEDPVSPRPPQAQVPWADSPSVSKESLRAVLASRRRCRSAIHFMR